jgi:hypothetical protein
MEDRTRRHFVKTSALGTLGLSLAGVLRGSGPLYEGEKLSSQTLSNSQIGNTITPRRLASWWCGIEDLQWPQKAIVDCGRDGTI